MLSSDVENVSENFSKWNPMEEAFRNVTFNRYSEGPGGTLDDELQPAAAEVSRSTIKPYLCLKNVPNEMTKKSIWNLFSNYCKVNALRQCRNNANMWFIEFESLNDMERAYNSAKNNIFGFDVYVGNKSMLENKTSELIPMAQSISPPQSVEIETIPRGIDFYNRSIKVPLIAPERPPLLQRNPFITRKAHENSELDLTDPQRHFLISHDMHSLDRMDTFPTFVKGIVNVHTGRLFFVESEEQLELIEQKHKTSEGTFCNKTNSFRKLLNGNILDDLKIGSCITCESLTHLSCKQCEQSYCSDECILSNSHPCSKKLFISINHQSISDQINDVIYPVSNSVVSITSVLRTNLFFIRSTTRDNNERYWQILNSISRHFYRYAENGCLRDLPQVGEIVVSKFCGTDYNRAFVLKAIDIDHIVIAYIDFGNIEIKKLKDLYPPTAQCYECPRLAIPFALKNVEDFQPTEQLSEFLNSCLKLGNCVVRFTNNNDDGIHEGELFFDGRKESVNNIIRKLRIIPVPSIHEVVVYDIDICKKNIEEGVHDIIIMDNSSIQETCMFSCICQEDLIPLQDFNVEINHYAANIKSNYYTPRIEEICLVKYTDGIWYRGRCLEVVGDGHPTIHFMDFGNITPVSINNIRKYPKEFKHRVATFDCEIAGLSEDNNEKIGKRLKELLPVGMKISGMLLKETDILKIEYNDLLNILKKEQLC